MSFSAESFLAFWVFAIGVAFGSFGNVVILRGIQGKSVNGRSACPQCGRVLTPLELIPILSFLCLRGQCYGCTKKISWQYPLVEAASGALFVFAFLHEVSPVTAILTAFALWLLLLLGMIDAKTGLVPDALSIPFIVLSLLASLSIGIVPWMPVLIALLFFGGQWTVSRGRWVGSGDIFLAVGIAALLRTTPLFLFSLFAAYIIGAGIACVLLVSHRKTMAESLPFGPFLAIGALVSLVIGTQVLAIYLPGF